MASVGDLVTVRIRARFDGEPIINNLSFSIINPAATWPLMAAQVVADLNTAIGVLDIGGSWVDGLSVQYAVEAVEVVDISPGTSPMVSVSSAAIGTVVDEDAMPPNDCMCVTLRSAFKGTSGRGRMYISGFAEGSANGGFWEAGAQSHSVFIAEELIINFGEDAAAANMRWCVLHSVSGGARLHPPEVKPIMGFTVHNEVRSLGRRAVGRRIHRHRVTA